jgi:hypothetical protein
MKPFQVSTKLRQIATKIENSKKPRKDLVANDIRQILSNINRQAAVPNDLDPKLQKMIDEFDKENDDWEYVEHFFDYTPKSEWTEANLEEYLDAYETY